VAFGAVGYASYNYYQVKFFEEEFNRNAKNQRSFMWAIHQKIAYNLDSILDKYEKGSKIETYRKVLLSYAEGFVLETGVGTSRNNRFYPPDCHVLGVDWASNMLEAALVKPKPLAEMDFKIEDVEKMTFKDDVFDTVVDTFGLDYYIDPAKALDEMKRVCKKDGKILLLCSGLSHYDYLNFFIEYKAPYTICNQGYFPNRDWEKYITPDKFEILKYERKLNGTIYFYILKNKK